MNFWGANARGGEPHPVAVRDGDLLHLSNASILRTEGVKPPSEINVTLNVEGTDYSLATLCHPNFSQRIVDLVLEQNFTLSHNWSNGVVSFAGYTSDQPAVADGLSLVCVVTLPGYVDGVEERELVKDVFAKKEQEVKFDTKDGSASHKVEILERQLQDQSMAAQKWELAAKEQQEAAEERERALVERVKELEEKVKEIAELLKTLKPSSSAPPS